MNKIHCPLCRKEITTIFRAPWAEAADPVERERVVDNVQEYNSRFDDNRPWARSIREFPYVFKRAIRFLTNPVFWVLFLRSLYFLRTFMFCIIYILLPMDFLPESLLGAIGYLDDFLIFFLLMAFGISTFALVYLRRRQ